MFLVKLGGRTQNDPALPAALAALWRATGGGVVVVHGGGDQISALQRLRGEEPVFVGGRRVTTDTALELVRMVLSGLANKQLVSALVAAGAPAVGVSGEDAALLRAVPIDVATFGHSGTPSVVDPRLVQALLAAGFHTRRAGFPVIIATVWSLDEAAETRYRQALEAAFRMLTQPLVEFFADELISVMQREREGGA